MPLDRLVLLVVIVLAAAGATVWIGAMVAAAVQLPAVGALVALPVLAVAYVIWRVIAERLSNREDDHYDHIEK